MCGLGVVGTSGQMGTTAFSATRVAWASESRGSSPSWRVPSRRIPSRWIPSRWIPSRGTIGLASGRVSIAVLLESAGGEVGLKAARAGRSVVTTVNHLLIHVGILLEDFNGILGGWGSHLAKPMTVGCKLGHAGHVSDERIRAESEPIVSISSEVWALIELQKVEPHLSDDVRSLGVPDGDVFTRDLANVQTNELGLESINPGQRRSVELDEERIQDVASILLGAHKSGVIVKGSLQGHSARIV